MTRPVRLVVEEHSDGFVAYPLGVEGAVVGEGATAEAAIDDARSALRFHAETFGDEVFSDDAPIDVFVAEEPGLIE